MSRKQRDPDRERQWRERIADWRTGGLSVRAFCAQHGLIETSFYYWKRELQARDTAASSASPKSSSGKQSRPAFIPLTVMPATVSVEVRCPSGHVVCLSSCEVSALAPLFAALNPQAGEERGC